MQLMCTAYDLYLHVTRIRCWDRKFAVRFALVRMLLNRLNHIEHVPVDNKAKNYTDYFSFTKCKVDYRSKGTQNNRTEVVRIDGKSANNIFYRLHTQKSAFF